jgi:beta-N-acetylhexosaminidase
MQRAFVCGLSGTVLTGEERGFLAEASPAGIIIFARNVENPAQLKRLIDDARDASGGKEKFLVLVDQEGGRVQRLGPPHWRKYPAADAFAKAFPGDRDRAAEAAWFGARLIAHDLSRLGFNACCAPVLDIPVAGADKVIGDRAYGSDPATVARLGGAAADGLLHGGVLPIMKHIPGHGRAASDSHFALPVIAEPLHALAETDFQPFMALRNLPMAMTAHVVLTEVDRAAPVTVSKPAIDTIIRGAMGFEGLLMSDDLSMKALSGGLAARASSAMAAGCDLALHCNGRLDEMRQVADAVPPLEGRALARFDAAFERLAPPQDFDLARAEETLAVSLAVAS